MLFRLFKLFKNNNSLNENKCPFCGKELDLADAKIERGRLISPAHEVNVLRINVYGELEIGRRKYEDRYERGTNYYTLFCPKDKYKILRTETHREESGKGNDSDSTYEVTHCDYEFISAGNLSEKQVKKLKDCCKKQSKDVLRVYKY